MSSKMIFSKNQIKVWFINDVSKMGHLQIFKFTKDENIKMKLTFKGHIYAKSIEGMLSPPPQIWPNCIQRKYWHQLHLKKKLTVINIKRVYIAMAFGDNNHENNNFPIRVFFRHNFSLAFVICNKSICHVHIHCRNIKK